MDISSPPYTEPPPSTISDPPEPPDSSTNMHEDVLIKTGMTDSQSFKAVLLNKDSNLNGDYLHPANDSTLIECRNAKAIPLTAEEKLRIYQPWQHSVIIKLYGKKLAHNYLKNKLMDL